jgi:hypothetical protein
MKLNFFTLFVVCSIFLSGCHRASKIEVYRAEKHQQDSIAFIEQQKSLDYYQSQLEILVPRVDSLLKLFKYEKNEKYQDKGYYYHPSQSSSYNAQRSYLQAIIQDDGLAIIKCFYYGAHPLRSPHIVLQAQDSELVLHGKTHSFDANGWHQITTIDDSTAMQALRFIDAYAQDQIRVRYANETQSGVFFYINEADKKTLLQSFQLAITISDIRELEKRIRITSLQVEKYQKRLQKR